MKLALVHDWFLSYSGAEKVINEIAKIFPGDAYAMFGKNIPSHIKKRNYKTSFLEFVPFIDSYYRYLLPLFPFAMKSLKFNEYDVIISSSHCMAKNLTKYKHQIHICYCHSPARYLWDMQSTYQQAMHPFIKWIFTRLSNRLKDFDYNQSKNVDLFIANSSFVKERIHQCYRKDAIVIHPPVNTHFFTPINEKKKQFFVTCARLVHYKNIKFLIRAFKNLPNENLYIIGDGPEKKNLKSIATKNIHFLGKVSDETLKQYLQQARAFLYGAIEDFGIILAEAISAGCPVIAYNQGGAKEIVSQDCGVLFDELSIKSIHEAINHLDKKTFDSVYMHQYAQKFSYERFEKEIKYYVTTYLNTCRR